MALADLLLCAKCDHPAHSHVHGRCSGEDGRPCPCGRFRSPSADKRELEQAGTARVDLDAGDASLLENLAWNIDQGHVVAAHGTMGPTVNALRSIAKSIREAASHPSTEPEQPTRADRGEG